MKLRKIIFLDSLDSDHDQSVQLFKKEINSFIWQNTKIIFRYFFMLS